MAHLNNDNTLLTRSQAGAALREAGFPIADKTLATKASRGGGPPFHRFGSRPLYRWLDALAWAQSRLTPPMLSTSEADVFRRTPQARQLQPLAGAKPDTETQTA